MTGGEEIRRMTESEWRKAVGDRIRKARKAKGFSQERLGEELGVSFQAVSNWEQGKVMPDTERLPILAGTLGLSLDDLFAEEDKEPRKWELKPVNFDAEHMFTFVKTRAKDLGMAKTLAVMSLLKEAHKGQPRRSEYGFETTYTVHPLTLACHALAMGLENDDLIAACVAHDMLEDTSVRAEDLPEGPVRDTVRLVSKNEYDQGRPDWEDRYYENIRKNPLACLVKCLDRVHNVAGMADSFSREKMAEYAENTDRYYPALLKAVKEQPEWNNAAWLLQYQLRAMTEAFKRLL